MFTQQTAIELSKSFINELQTLGYAPSQAYLFGSYAHGTPNAYSDIDIAIWDDKFTGCLSIDWDAIKYLLIRYTAIEPHTYSTADTEENNPFIGVIKRDGIRIL
jgi:DNA polymerase sigma